MNSETLLLAVAPLVLFALFDIFVGPRAGIIAALVSAIAFGIWTYFVVGEWDSLATVEITLIFILGILSIRLKNSIYFKMQPVVVGVVLALYLAYFQYFGTPVLVRMIPMLKKLSPDLSSFLDTQNFHDYASAASFHLVFVFFIHAIFVGLAAKKYSTKIWLGTRFLIYPLVLFVFFIDRLLYL